MTDVPPQEAQYDEFGRPLHPVVAAIHNATAGPVVPPTQEQQASQPVQQMNKPDFSPVQVPPAPLTSTQQAVKADSPPDPRDPQFKNSKLRTILNSIGAGLTGAANPQAGIALGKSLRDAKYNKAKESYDVTHGKNLEQEGIEEKNRTAEIEKARLGVTRGAAQSTSDNREELAKTRERAADTQAAREQDYRANVASMDKQRIANEKKIEEQTKKEADRNEALRKAVETRNFSDYTKAYYAPKETPEEAAKKAGAIRDAQIASDNSPAGQQRITNQATSRVVGTGTPAALKAEEDAAKAKKTGEEAGATSPEAIEGQAKLARAKSLAQLTANEKDVSHKAQIALQALPDIRKDVDAASDSLFSNRWKEFRTGTLGTEDSQKYAALRANVSLLQTIVSQIHTGNRGVSKILDKFTNMFNVDKMNKQTFQDSLNAVEKWVQRYSTLPKVDGGYDVGDIDKQVESGATGKFGVITKQ